MAETKLTRRALVAGAAVAAAGGGTALGASEDAPLQAAFVRGPLPLDKPGARAWARAKPIAVPVFAQQMAPPFLHSASVRRLLVRALASERELGFLIEWEDKARNEKDGLNVFQDAVAVMLPVRMTKQPPVITMGSKAERVHILQWRASWQHDIEHPGGLDDRVEDLFPRVIRDVSPSDVLPDKTAVLWSPALATGNPLSVVKPKAAVNEIVAAGFGTTTTVAKQQARGWGARTDTGWRVAIGLPLRRGAGDALPAGGVVPIAFAVWSGGGKNRGGRKHWANWVNCGVPRGG